MPSARNFCMQSILAMKTQFCIYFALCIGVVITNPVSWNFTSEYNAYNSFALPIDTANAQYAPIGAKRCMKQLDCFEITSDFYDPLRRPVNLLPHDRTSIDTKFQLYTKLHPMEKHILSANDPEDIKESGINPTHKTVFIVHGFFDSQLYGKWMETLKTSFMLHGDYNVIIVDWSKGNGAPYTQATANTRVVGAEIALLIKALQKAVGISPMDCHIIGHSLGSHIAGYAGERLKKLGRISALDPAQPYFQGLPPSVRIDPTDADFVDVIHTDSSSSKFLALGMSQAVGHVDFYPNNGMNQPGCTFSAIHSIFLEGLIDAVRQFVACNHQRSVTFFTYSLNFKKALPVGHQCKNWNDYREGLCSDCGKQGERCAIMGMKADEFKKFKNDSNSIKMYLTTGGAAPFWVFSYQVTIKLEKPTTSFKDRSGDMYITVQGSKTRFEFQLTTKSGDLIHGATYSFFVSNQEDLGKIQSVTFKWITKAWNIFRRDNIYLEFVKITPMNIIEKEIRDQNTKKFCRKSNKPIDSKQDVLLNECS